MNNDKFIKLAGLGLLVWFLLKKKAADVVEEQDLPTIPPPPDSTTTPPMPPIGDTALEKRRMLENYSKRNGLGWSAKIPLMTDLEVAILYIYIFECQPDPECTLSNDLAGKVRAINNKFALRIRI